MARLKINKDEREEAENNGLNQDEERSLERERIGQLEKQIFYLKADLENFKRNTAKEHTELKEQGKEEVLKDFLKIIELLEKALKIAQEKSVEEAFLEGLELILKECNKILEKHNLQRIPTVGEQFDPRIHEAISVVKAQDNPPGIIIYEQEPGYIRLGKVLKPAKVVVSEEAE